MKFFLTFFICVCMIFLAVFGVNCVYGVIFPVKFKEEIFSACEKYDLEPAIVFSLINVESHFDKSAESSKGAVGLMQIMPTTAKEVALKINLNNYDLKNPRDNVLLGTYYLSTLFDRFEILETALAAYNAGPTNVNTWLKDEKYSNDGKHLIKIPFDETKNYIIKFSSNYNYYSKKI